MPQNERHHFQSRTFFIGGKAAHGYIVAKNIIKFINCVAEVLNKDLETNDKLMLVFCPDYNVSNAEVIIPAAEISQVSIYLIIYNLFLYWRVIKFFQKIP